MGSGRVRRINIFKVQIKEFSLTDKCDEFFKWTDG